MEGVGVGGSCWDFFLKILIPQKYLEAAIVIDPHYKYFYPFHTCSTLNRLVFFTITKPIWQRRNDRGCTMAEMMAIKGRCFHEKGKTWH